MRREILDHGILPEAQSWRTPRCEMDTLETVREVRDVQAREVGGQRHAKKQLAGDLPEHLQSEVTEVG